MKKFSLVAKAVITAMSMVGMVYADNSWTGVYAGVDAGLTFNKGQLKSQQVSFSSQDEKCNTSSNLSTFFPGVQLGYMHQFPSYLVSGIEANFSFNANQKKTLSCNCSTDNNVFDRFIFMNQMQSSIKGRVGRALNWNQSLLLPYLIAGMSFANLGLTYKNEGGDYYSDNAAQVGWLMGAGIEWAIWQHWSMRAEYYYANYGNTINLQIPSAYGLVDPNGKARINLNSNTLAVAINYWL